MKKLFLTSVLAALSAFVLSAQQPAGGLSPEMLEQISSTYEDNAYDKAISNALAGTSIATLAINADNAALTGLLPKELTDKCTALNNSILLGTLNFLTDPAASGFVTGVVIPVDGGFSAYSGV
ncbi:MAG: hypothetical protein J6Q12_03710 [Bacteroidales bacterium]|nr:hypothetical protein [Bacteroidales bacterium]